MYCQISEVSDIFLMQKLANKFLCEELPKCSKVLAITLSWTTEPEKWQLNSLNLLRQLTDMNINMKMKVI